MTPVATDLAWLRERFELSRGEAGGNVPAMEGIRGFAVFLVFLNHFATLASPWVAKGSVEDQVLGAMFTIGMTGVDLFFVLSGYLIYGSLIARPQPFTKFMARRVERIYPAFLAVFALYLVLSVVFPSENKIPTQLVAGAVYIAQNLLLLPGIFPIPPLITVAWSLSYEMLYYLAIPLVISLFGLRAHVMGWRIAFFGCIAVATAAYCAAFVGPIRLIMFIAGIFLFETLRNSQWRGPGGALGCAALVAGMAVMLLPVPGSVAYTLKIVALFCCFYAFGFACFRHPASTLARAFSWTPLRWLGNMSYSYFLLHGLTLKAALLVAAKIVPPSVTGPAFVWLLLPPMFLVTLMPTALLFLLVERPFSLTRRKAGTG